MDPPPPINTTIQSTLPTLATISTQHQIFLNKKSASSSKPQQLKRKDRLRELQQFYYGYVITKRNRHLGLVRRRAGRGGRIILDKFNEDLTDSISDCDLKGSGSARTMNKQKNNEQMMFQFDFTKL